MNIELSRSQSLGQLNTNNTSNFSGAKNTHHLPISIKSIKNTTNSLLKRSFSYSPDEGRQIRIEYDPRMLVTTESDKDILKQILLENNKEIKPQKKPTAHVVSGQMGAGKSTLATKLYKKEPALLIDYDSLKATIPGYSKEASKGYPGTVPGCKELARYLVESQIKSGLENNQPMIIQSTIKNQCGSTLQVVKDLKKHGYHVTFHILAAHKTTSKISILLRYEAALKEINEKGEVKDGARRTPMSYHDNAYKFLVDEIALEQLLPYIDKLIVETRSGKTLYSTSDNFDISELINKIREGREADKPDEQNLLVMFEKLSQLVAFNAKYPSREGSLENYLNAPSPDAIENRSFCKIAKLILSNIPKQGTIGISERVRLEAFDKQHRRWHIIVGADDKNGAREIWKNKSTPLNLFDWMDKNPNQKVKLGSNAEGVDLGEMKIGEASNVVYLSKKESVKFKVNISEKGVWYSNNGECLDTRSSPGKVGLAGYSIIVVHSDKKIYVHDAEAGKLHHTTTTEGKPVIAAGAIRVEDGIATSFSLVSGHYLPTADSLSNLIDILKENNVDVKMMRFLAPKLTENELTSVLKKHQLTPKQ